ncbi:hypothetical protein [Streptomyces sp. B8F3]
MIDTTVPHLAPVSVSPRRPGTTPFGAPPPRFGDGGSGRKP